MDNDAIAGALAECLADDSIVAAAAESPREMLRKFCASGEPTGDSVARFQKLVYALSNGGASSFRSARPDVGVWGII